MENLNCETCKTFKKQLANNRVGLTVRDMILDHIYTCKECREAYREYYESIGKKFHIYNEMFSFLRDFNDSTYKFNSKVEKIISNNVNLTKRYKDYKDNKWFNYAKEGNVPKLTNLVAFKEIMDYEVNIPEEEKERDNIIETLYRYGLYEAEKIAKKVDMLERCLILEHTGGTND